MIDEAELKEKSGTAGVPMPSPMDAEITISFYKWDAAFRKALLEKFGPGISEEALMNDGKGKTVIKEKKGFKNFPEDRWLSDKKREKYYRDVQVRLAYFQEHLPLIKSLEGIPEMAEHYNGPSSDDIWLLMHHSLPNKEKDPGDIMLFLTIC